MDTTAASNDALPMDPIWTSSRTARQIYALGEVDKDISRLISLAASSVALLSLPQTDSADSTLPQGDERSEQFVLEVSEYFERLDPLGPSGVPFQQIHINIRSTLAQIRQSRVAPSAINAPPPGFVPQSSGVGIPTTDDQTGGKSRGLQEERINRNAWKGIVDALTRLKSTRDSDQEAMYAQMHTGP